MGGDFIIIRQLDRISKLKSTPPAWAGTFKSRDFVIRNLLKSTPPAWAGTCVMAPFHKAWGLKSTPPAWAGTFIFPLISRTTPSLNPPRPHGRGL